VVFGCLVAFDDVSSSPAWLVWPAFAAMIVGVFGGLLLEWRRGDRRTWSVVGVLALAAAAFAAARLL
jgi:hypothetical protein